VVEQVVHQVELQEILLFFQQLPQQVVVVEDYIILMEVNQEVQEVELQEVINQEMQVGQL
jgi:hypothetical protein